MVEDIAVDPNNTATILAAIDGTGVNRTTDGGATWQIGVGGSQALAGRSIRFRPATPRRCFSVPVRSRSSVLPMAATPSSSPPKVSLNWISSRLMLIRSTQWSSPLHSKAPMTEVYCLPRMVALLGY